PYFEGVDRLAIRVQKIQLHASMAPDAENPSDFQPLPAGGVKKADGGGLPENINQEEIMVKVMDVLIQGVYNSLNVKLKAKNIPMKAEQIIALSYNKTDWTLRAKLSTKVMQYLIPAGIIGDFHLTAFQFTSKGWTVGIQTAQ
ncbi:MAG TPA: hypothetical protein PKI19_14340, partial [Elusimicrobiales bacterium]|nr:hypothetical protein [Elusimicrobiales bacterium]